MRFRDLAAIELARLGVHFFRKFVHKDFAVNLGRVHRRTTFQQQVALFGGAFEKQVKLASYQRSFFLLADLPLDAHQMLAPALNFARRKFIVQAVSRGALLVWVGEGSHPIELPSTYKIAKL